MAAVHSSDDLLPTCSDVGRCRVAPGTFTPGAPRTVREPLDSYGSRCSAVAMAESPVGGELGIRPAEPVEPVSCAVGLMAHPRELAACPPDDIGVDPLRSVSGHPPS